MLNAACDDYGLLHHVLRGPELLRRYEPRALIVAIATGDDVAALADPRLPHLEVGLLPAPPRVAATADPLGLAARAQQLGIVNRVVPAAELAGVTYDYARDLAHNVSPRSMRVIKRQLYEVPFQSLAEATIDANREMAASVRSEDFREGVAHFIEKRPARFTGR